MHMSPLLQLLKIMSKTFENLESLRKRETSDFNYNFDEK